MVGEALAGTAFGGPEGERLHGGVESEALIGNGGGDRIYGFAGDDGLAGGAGADELYGGAGRDVLLGGAGDDFLEARDGQRDYLDCGAGRHDMTSVDEEDKVSGNCEYVYRS
jgi:Ca2+-binding RTX toxin-like protein